MTKRQLKEFYAMKIPMKLRQELPDTKKTSGAAGIHFVRNGSSFFRAQLNQDGLVRFQIFLDGLYAVARIGDADGVGLAQFVMHQQFADHSHLKISFRHPPELAGFQRLLADATGRLGFCHN
jgi:hypothetical protein